MGGVRLGMGPGCPRTLSGQLSASPSKAMLGKTRRGQAELHPTPQERSCSPLHPGGTFHTPGPHTPRPGGMASTRQRGPLKRVELIIKS